MTGHTLDVAWLCPGCGHRVPAGETVHPHGDGAWRCAACLPPATPPWRKPQPARKPRILPPDPPTPPWRKNRAKPKARYAKGTTLEELLAE